MRPNALHCLLQGLLTAAAVAITAPMIAGAAETAPAVVTAESLPPGAAPPSLIRKVESRFSTFVGGTENADSLAIGLRNGTPVRLTGFDANDQPVTVTFTPATGHMGVGNVMHSLNVASRVVGMVVDSVSDVTTLRSDQIRPAPEFAATVDTRYINGLGTLGERMLIVVDIERLMLSSEMALVDEATA